jgi:predicted HicB family RNase H-like nuclease
MQVTIEVSDEVVLQANRKGFSVQELVMQAIQEAIGDVSAFKYTYCSGSR